MSPVKLVPKKASKSDKKSTPKKSASASGKSAKSRMRPGGKY